MEIFLAIVTGLCIPFFLYWIQKKSQDKIDTFTQNSLKTIHQQSTVAKDILVDMRNENYRIFMKLFGDDNDYWRFKWRFETWDYLGLIVETNGSDNAHKYLRIQILGTTENFQNITYDQSYDYYICKVIESNWLEYFPVGTVVSCFYFNDKEYISKYVGSIVEPEEKFTFSIGGLGTHRVGGQTDRDAITVKYFPRAKDFKLDEIK